jgi:hypothetical protein
MFTRTDPEWNELDTWEEQLAKTAVVSNQIPNDSSWHCVGHFATEIEARIFIESPGWKTTVVRSLHLNQKSDKPYWVMAAKRSKRESDEGLDNPVAQYGENAVALCEAMVPLINDNGYKTPPKLTKEWYRSAKLVLDRAAELGKTPESVFALAEWALKHEFWLQNIRSTSGFYKHYDRLREQANKAHIKDPVSMQTHWERTRAKSENVWDMLEAESNKEAE